MGPIEQMATELARREAMKPKIEWQAPQAEPRQDMKPISPNWAQMIGAGVDGIGTYKMLKQPGYYEANPVLNKMFNNNPLGTAVGAAGTGLAGLLVRRALEKWGGNVGRAVSPALGAQLGSQQLMLGLDNLTKASPYDKRNGFERVADKQLLGNNTTSMKGY